jgi:hypothetical protein
MTILIYKTQSLPAGLDCRDGEFGQARSLED